MENLENKLESYQGLVIDYNESLETSVRAIDEEKESLEELNQVKLKYETAKKNYKNAQTIAKQKVDLFVKLKTSMMDFDPIAVITEEMKVVATDLEERSAIYSTLENLPSIDERIQLLDSELTSKDKKQIEMYKKMYENALEFEDLKLAETIKASYQEAEERENKRTELSSELNKIAEPIIAGIVVNKQKDNNLELYVSVNPDNQEGLSEDLLQSFGNTHLFVDDAEDPNFSESNGVLKINFKVDDADNYINVLKSQVPENFADANVEYKVIVVEGLEDKFVATTDFSHGSTPPTDDGQETPPTSAGEESDNDTMNSSEEELVKGSFKADKVYTQKEAAEIWQAKSEEVLGTSRHVNSYIKDLSANFGRGTLEYVKVDGKRCITETVLNEKLEDYFVRKLKNKSGSSEEDEKVGTVATSPVRKKAKVNYEPDKRLEEQLGIPLRKLFADKDYLPVTKTGTYLGHADNYLYFGNRLDTDGGSIRTKKKDGSVLVNLLSLERHLGPSKLYSTREVALILKDRAEKELGNAYGLESYQASLNRDIREEKVNAVKVGKLNYVPQKQMDIYLGNYFARRKIQAIKDETISSRELAELLMVSTGSVNNKAKHGFFEKAGDRGMYLVDSAKDFVEKHTYDGRGWKLKERFQ